MIEFQHTWPELERGVAASLIACDCVKACKALLGDLTKLKQIKVNPARYNTSVLDREMPPGNA